MRARLSLVVLPIALVACERAADAPPPMGLAGGPAPTPAGMGAGVNPVAPVANPHAAAPANPHAAPAGDPNGPKASPFPTEAPVVVRGDRPAGDAPAAPAKAIIAGIVKETMNAAGYTYIRVQTNAGDTWVAVGESKVEVDKPVSVVESLTMTDFHSKALNRTFPSIVFGTLQ